jgi:anaerobic ribonucleoside-triphosphate reductase activating protein
MSSPPPLNLAAFLKGTRMVGPGLRDAVWVQGCSIRCPGCANQAYLAHEERRRVPVERLLAHFAVRRGAIDGLSVLGGEPTEQPEAVAALLQGVQDLGMSTVLFSGRTWEDLRTDPVCAALLAHTDLLIDGPFLLAEQDLTLAWRGSRNQRLLRLTERFGPEDLVPPEANGEIFIGPDGVLLHGIGTLALATPSQTPANNGSEPRSTPALQDRRTAAGR